MEISWVLNYNAALVTNIAAILILWKKYKVAALLHPFNYYLITWIISLLSFGVAISVGLSSYLIYDEKLLSQLFFTVAFVGLVICLVLILGKKLIIRESFNWKIPEKFLKNFGIIILCIGIFLIFTKGFDVAQNRFESIAVGNADALSGERIGVVGVIFGLFFMLKIPLLIYNGTQFYSMIIAKTEKFKYYIFFVLIGSILEVISGGGRSGIVSALTFFIIGIVLHHIRSTRKISNLIFLKKIAKFALIPVLLLSFYINFVAAERAEKGGYVSVTEEALSKSSSGKWFSGVMEYSIFHILGYQYRIEDTATDELEMGQYTFQFITLFNIPVLSQVFKTDLNLANALDLKTVNTRLGTLEAEKNGLKAHSTTATVFFVLYDDFGLFGSLIVIVIFAVFTSRIYNKLLQRDINGYFSLIVWLFLFDLWKNTWFSHHLNGSIFNPYLYSAILLYFVNKYFRNK
jgi:oligosaccharide repeat unit polymerase